MIMNITVQAILALSAQTNLLAWENLPHHWNFMLFYTVRCFPLPIGDAGTIGANWQSALGRTRVRLGLLRLRRDQGPHARGDRAHLRRRRRRGPHQPLPGREGAARGPARGRRGGGRHADREDGRLRGATLSKGTKNTHDDPHLVVFLVMILLVATERFFYFSASPGRSRSNISAPESKPGFRARGAAATGPDEQLQVGYVATYPPLDHTMRVDWDACVFMSQTGPHCEWQGFSFWLSVNSRRWPSAWLSQCATAAEVTLLCR